MKKSQFSSKWLVVWMGAIAMTASVASADTSESNEARTQRLSELKLRPGTLGVELHFLLKPEDLTSGMNAVPGATEMTEIVRVGSRAVRWADILQKDLPIEKREQLWRRLDHLGKEPTPANPMRYNPALIQAAFEKAMRSAPPKAVEVFGGLGALPSGVPTGLKLTEVISAIREVSLSYSRASRWLMLYDWHDVLDKESRDLRPWLALKDRLPDVEGRAQNWSKLSRAERSSWIGDVSKVCSVGGASSPQCASAHSRLVEQSESGPALEWLKQVMTGGQLAYDAHFGVTFPHRGAKVRSNGDQFEVLFEAVGVPLEALDWISSQVEAGWVFPGSISAVLRSTAEDFEGAVHVDWQAGALPHVNAVGGDTITMDSNLAQWLEQAQVTMTHEFGHVVGFPDCYAEFWDPSEPNGGAFVEYALDTEDRMCALSGKTLDRHRVALLKAFGK